MLTNAGLANLLRGTSQQKISLDTLILSRTKVTGAGLARFGGGCRGLKKIGLAGLAATNAGLRAVKSCPGLEDVDLEGEGSC